MNDERTGARGTSRSIRSIDIDDPVELERLCDAWCVSERTLREAVALVGPMPEAVAYLLSHQRSAVAKEVTDDIRAAVRLRAAHRSAYWLARKLRTSKVDHDRSIALAELRARVEDTRQAMLRFLQDLDDHRVILAAAATPPSRDTP